jgi:hypothetical protein
MGQQCSNTRNFRFEFEFASIRRIRFLEISIRFVESKENLATNLHTLGILRNAEYSRNLIQNSFMIPEAHG